MSTRPLTDSKTTRCGRSQRMLGDLYAIVVDYLGSDLDIGYRVRDANEHGRSMT